MSELVNTSKRQLVPRWHDSSEGSKYVKWKPRKRINIEQETQQFEFEFDKWTKNKTLPVAMELVERMHNFDIDLSKCNSMLRDFLLDSQHKLTTESHSFVTDSHVNTEENQVSKELGIHARINALKIRARDMQADPLAWHDLAYHYSILNEDIKAEKCLKIAMKVSRNNSYIARSFSRFLVHKDDPDKAVQILAKLKSTDPRITSAEVSIRARFGVGKPNLKQARKLIDRNESTPGIISELAASLATIDCELGNGKRANKFIEMSLRDHTENVEAQVRWLLQRYNAELPTSAIDQLSSPEATAIDFYERDMLYECRDSLIHTYEFQPFSAGSLIDATFLSVALGDYESVISVSNEYEYAIRENGMAQNNLAVALVLSDNLGQASEIVNRLENTNFARENETTFLATKGLLNYRMGNPLEGKRLYELAREGISSSDQRDLEALSCAFQSSEEIKVDRETGEELLARAERLSPRTSLEKEICSFSRIVRENNNLVN